MINGVFGPTTERGFCAAYSRQSRCFAGCCFSWLRERCMDKYKAIVLDDQEHWREVLVRTLSRRDFHAVGYSEAERLLSEVFDVIRLPDEQPDLVVVDLKLRSGKMQGIDLIDLLMSRELAFVIVAITGDLTGDVAEQAMKLGAAVVGKGPDNFLADNFLMTIQKMERLAEIGRKRRK